MKNDYFNLMEDINIANLQKFNNKANWFKTIIPTKRGTSSDATCYTHDDRKITVELKTRKGTIEDFKRFGDILIEPGKMSHFTAIMESGFTLNEDCLYINFLNDGVMIHDFNKLEELVVYPNHKQYNPGKRQYEYETRYGLKTKDAIIYKYNEDGTMERC